MEIPSGKIIINGKLTDIKESGLRELILPGSVYDVVRLIGKCPLFMNDHLSRLYDSCLFGGKEILAESTEIKRCIALLQTATALTSCNIRISFNYTVDGSFYLVHFIDSFYPDPEMYRQGVSTELFRAERSNPSLKIYDTRLREKVSELLKTSGAFEIILVDSDGRITEGSKSNIFFVKDDTLVTAPDEKVLSGITRKYVIDISGKLGLKIEYRMICEDELENFDSVFLCGTSPMILPVSGIGEHKFTLNNTIVQALIREYSELVEASLKECL